MRIGIPRALTFYRYYPFLKTFLEGCGHEVVASPPTDLRLLEMGVESCVDDFCVAVKVFFGHARFLGERVEALLVPRVVSVEKGPHDTFTCPKLIAAPDMIRFLRGRPPLLLEWVLDAKKTPWWWGCLRLGTRLRVSPGRVRKAYLAALHEHSIFESLLLQSLLPDEAVSIWENMVYKRHRPGIEGERSAHKREDERKPPSLSRWGAGEPLSAIVVAEDGKAWWAAVSKGAARRMEAETRIQEPSGEISRAERFSVLVSSRLQDRGEVRRGDVRRERATVGLVGHPYLLADRLVNKNLIRWLEEAGAVVVPCTLFSPRELEKEMIRIPEMSWSYERELLAAVLRFAGLPGLDGIVYLTSFGCGPDSMAMELARREIVAPHGKPFLEVVLDEHSADSGVRTRAEAFVDMLKRRKSAGTGGTTSKERQLEGVRPFRRDVSRFCFNMERGT
ncbi:MAG: acyl-CoA dehydratase activase-related protein [Actinomycetota bacterium]